MLEIKFRGSSSQGHVIHKVNFKVVEKVQKSIFSNQENNDSFGFLVKLTFQQYQFYGNWPYGSRDMRTQS